MTGQTLDHRFAEAMGQLLGPEFPKHIALAVSGGGDSMAMLALAHNWTRVWGVQLWVVTVDHGLREGSADEAAMVARECDALGWPHATLRWHWDKVGNLQDAARRARLELIDRWRAGIEHVLFAHTADDLAETFLMRLARGSGVSGLAAMEASHLVTPHPNGKSGLDLKDVDARTPPPISMQQVGDGPIFSKSFRVIRPCLEMSREELRTYARHLKMPWVDDPSNDDPRFDRVTVRKLMPLLQEAGIDAQNLRATAKRMRRAEDALRARAVSVAQQICRPDGLGVVSFDRAGFEETERDTQMRLLAAACCWVSGAQYRPRVASLETLLDTLLGGGAGTLIGTQCVMEQDRCLVFRELAAVEASVEEEVWDGRWQIVGPQLAGLRIAALGEAIKHCDAWRDAGLPRAALMASPAVWDGDDLVAAPLAGHNPAYSAHIVTDFASFLLSH